jgi:hypothetical protein
MADLLVDESGGIARKIKLVVERARDSEAAAEILGRIGSGQSVNVDLFSTHVKIEGGNGIAIGAGATANNLFSAAQSRTSQEGGEITVDPISIIVAALVAGAATGATGVATDAISDAYKALKGVLQRAFSKKGDFEAEKVLDELEKDPGATEDTLRSKLADQEIDKEADVVAAARNLLAKADPDGYAAGKYNVSVSGGQGVIVGDAATQTNTFGAPPRTE